ncbi:MAG: hypothetical protein IPI43_30070 [Sandaracinaceae bacterium]|nr:hypothetical protein [Sandaracinaceae bacterium]
MGAERGAAGLGSAPAEVYVSMWRSLIVLALVAPAPAAWAYKCTRTAITSGPSLTWRARQVSWVLDSDLTGDIANKAATRATIKASFQTWTHVPCSDPASCWPRSAAT